MSGLSKRLDAAREAFERRNAAAAAHLHDPQRVAQATSQPSTTSWLGTYLGSMVYGGLNGIITTFAVVSGVAGAQLGADVILILGIGNLLADGFSMGTGDYLSTKTEREYYDEEARRQAWEIDTVPDGQRAELHAYYIQHGYTEDEADQLVAVQTQHKDRWVKAMMLEELQMVREDTNPIYNGIATFIAFVIAGSLPLIIYLIGLFTPIAPDAAFPISVVLSALALFGLGAAKVFVTRRNPIRSGLEMLVVGGLAALVAYVIGVLLQNIGG
jgi:vacuolar iron transporter family protein